MTFFLAILCCSVSFAWYACRSTVRSSLDVLEDLRMDTSSGATMLRSVVNTENTHDHAVASGLDTAYKTAGTASFRTVSMEMVLGLVIAIVLSLCFGIGWAAVSICLSGLSLGYLVGQYRFRARNAHQLERLEQLLPIVMERLVMAVQAGLDVTAAVQAVINLEKKYATRRRDSLDPVTELLELVLRLTESGIGFNRALRDVAEVVPSTALKHAFIHLAVAYEEGGELVMPLRELSDSTQLYYQEIVEEKIAKLPVKATMPLVCTFAGLIIFFITTPLLQVMNIVSSISLP